MFKTRQIYNDISEHASKKECTIITGPRQAGKTTILRYLFNELKKKEKYVLYVTLEDTKILEEINNHPENIFKFIKRPINPLYKANPDKERIFILVDEVQYAKNPSNFLKYLYDTYLDNLKIIATGSSAFYIDKKFKDSLAGRKRIFILNTLNFNEFLYFRNENLLIEELKLIRHQKEYISVHYHEIMSLLDEYLTYGGYPDVVLESDNKNKINKLLELRNSYVKRDFIESGLQNETTYFQLMALLSGQIGNLVNRNEFAGTLKIDNKTVDNYLYNLQKCFYIDLVLPFYKNLRKELTKMPKVFFNDLGLRNVLLNRFTNFHDREDKGQLLENYVYIRLKEIYKQDDIKFWRTASGNEVDFIVSETFGKGKAFEVKYKTTLLKKSKYKLFRNTYPDYPISFVQFDFSPEPTITPVLKL